MNNEITFFTDPYDPLVEYLFNELLKNTELLREDLIEQSIKKITLRYRTSDEKKVRSLVEIIKYYPLRFTSEKIPEKALIEKHFNTIVLYFYRDYDKTLHEDLEYFEEYEKDHGFIYPITRGNHMIFRSSHEIFYFKEYVMK
jgi:hypothetical protein